MIETFSHLAVVQKAFAGIRICVCVLILNAVIKLFRKAIVDKATLVIFIAVMALAYFTPLNPVIFVIIAAVLGIVIQNFKGEGK